MTKVYRYGLLAPTVGASIVREQLRLAHRYKNDLIQVERGKRAAMREALLPFDDVRVLEERVSELSERVAATDRELRAARVESRSKVDAEPLREALRSARSELSLAKKALASKRKEAREDPSVIVATDVLGEKRNELRRSARGYSGLRHGTYTAIEDAVSKADSDTPLYDGAEPLDPRFSRFTGEGSIGVQIPGGAKVADVFGGQHTQFQIDRPADSAWYSEIRSERRLASRTVCRVRVGSNEDRTPVWAEWPMVMHRPLPDGSVIKRAMVSLTKRGPREEWALLLTVDTASAHVAPVPGGAVAVDLGWRSFGDRLRVARWYGTDGASGEICLDERMIGGLRKPEGLRSTRDANFDAARDALWSWIKANRPASDGAVAGAWFWAATESLWQWKSQARLGALVRRWAGARFDGDAEAFGAAEAWRYHDHHLWSWEEGQRTGSLRARREVYRVAAASLAKRYGTLVLEDFDLSKVARGEKRTEQETAGNSNRQLAAPSELRAVMENAFGKDRTKKVDPYQSTHECHGCGHVDAFDAAAHVKHVCSACGLGWDQDDNAARVLCERWISAPEAVSARAPRKTNKNAIDGETRWERARRMRAAKEARMATAREALDNCAE